MDAPQKTDGEIVGLGTPNANVRHYPVGTLDELLNDVCKGDEERFEHARKLFATCSKPDPDNRGCPFFKKCEFKKWRGKSGPRRVGVLSAFIRAAAAIRVMPCFVYMSVMHAIRMLSKSQAVRVIAQEGDYVKVKETRRVNPKDPKDPRHHLVYVQRLIKPFPRPIESLADVAFTMDTLQESEAQRLLQRDRDVLGAAFVGNVDELVQKIGVDDTYEQAGQPTTEGGENPALQE